MTKSVPMDVSDSTANLTRPTLDSIYDSSELLNENDENNDVYSQFSEDLATSKSHSGHRSPSAPPSSLSVLLRLFLVGLSGILFAKVTEHMHDNNLQLTSHLVYKPFELTHNFSKRFFGRDIPKEFVDFFFGIILGLIQPTLDLLFPKSFSLRIFTSSTKNHMIVDFNSIVRSTIALLGISFGLRKIDWESSLQSSLAFSFVNPCVWLLLDSTISGFIGCSLTALLYSLIVFKESTNDYLVEFLFIASYFFISLLIYGKIGRFLFG